MIRLAAVSFSILVLVLFSLISSTGPNAVEWWFGWSFGGRVAFLICLVASSILSYVFGLFTDVARKEIEEGMK